MMKRNPTVEDYESDEDSEDEDDDMDWAGDDIPGSDEEDMDDDSDDPIFNPVLTAYDKLYEGFMQESVHIRK